MDERRTALGYGSLGVASLLLSLVLGSSGGLVFEGPGPLAFDVVLALQVAGGLSVLMAVFAALGRLPDWDLRDDGA